MCIFFWSCDIDLCRPQCSPVQWTAPAHNNSSTSIYKLVQSLLKTQDNNNPPIWIVNIKGADICQSNLADSTRPSFMGITRHAGIEVHTMSRNLCDFSWTASIGISSVTAILCSNSWKLFKYLAVLLNISGSTVSSEDKGNTV